MTVLVALAAMTALACGGGSEGRPPGDRQLPPAILAGEGTPTGEASGAAIGADGGTLASPGGRLTVVVPPGAVPGGASFTVQPITHTALGGVGGAFRLGPEGMTFATPVTLVFRGPDTYASGTGIEGLGIAYQDASGFWRPVPDVVRDPAANTLTAEVTHFSDWGLTWQDGVPGLYGSFTLSQTLGAVPFDAAGAATLFYQGQSDAITLYVLTGSVSPVTPVPAACSYVTEPPVETLVPTTAQVWSAPAQFRWSIDAAWELTCSEGPAEQLMAAVFDTTGLSMAAAGCTRGYVGTPVIGTDGVQGTYVIDCGTSGSATATWSFIPCVPGVECTDPALNPCVTQAIACATGMPVCTETGTHVADGTACGPELLDQCAAGSCGCVAGAGCPAVDACHTAAVTCDPTACTQTALTGDACVAQDACHTAAWTCDPATGPTCTQTALTGDACVAQDACHTAAWSCDPATGPTCAQTELPDGTPCESGTCTAGVCSP